MFGPLTAEGRQQVHAEQMRLREMSHAERMKALELGRPLPEVEIARAKADEVKARTEAAKTIVGHIFRAIVPVGLFGIAVGATAVVVTCTNSAIHLTALAFIWIAAGVVALGTVLAGIAEARRWVIRTVLNQEGEPLTADETNKLINAIQK